MVTIDRYKSIELPINSIQHAYGESICDLKVNSLAIWCGIKANKYIINGLSGMPYKIKLSDELIKNTYHISIPCDTSKVIFNYDR